MFRRGTDAILFLDKGRPRLYLTREGFARPKALLGNRESDCDFGLKPRGNFDGPAFLGAGLF